MSSFSWRGEFSWPFSPPLTFLLCPHSVPVMPEERDRVLCRAILLGRAPSSPHPARWYGPPWSHPKEDGSWEGGCWVATHRKRTHRPPEGTWSVAGKLWKPLFYEALKPWRRRSSQKNSLSSLGIHAWSFGTEVLHTWYLLLGTWTSTGLKSCLKPERTGRGKGSWGPGDKLFYFVIFKNFNLAFSSFP